jgi:hypothetical protein
MKKTRILDSKSKTSQGLIPVIFTLRGVNASEILEDFIKENYYNNVQNGVIIIKHEINQNVVKDEDPNNQSFYYTCNTTKQIVHTTNQDRYKIVLETGNPNIESEFTCLTCNKTYKMIPFGIPVKLETLVINYLIRYVFHITKPYYCCFEHVYEALTIITDIPNSDPMYRTSEEMLKMMHEIMYPNKELSYLKNKDLYKNYHGFLDNENSQSRYVKSPNLICLPVKEQYFEF